MDSKNVLKILGITRPTLTKYVKEGMIKVKEKPNGRYDYSQEDVYKFLYRDIDRYTCIYASTWKDELAKDTDRQVSLMERHCAGKGYKIGKILVEDDCTVKMDSREKLKELIDDVIDGKVEHIIVVNKYRISKTEFEMFEYMVNKYNTTLEVLTEA